MKKDEVSTDISEHSETIWRPLARCNMGLSG